MKRVTASDARKNWFRILDEVVAGETVVIERDGHRVLLQRDDGEEEDRAPAYDGLLAAEGDVERADRWRWEWHPDSDGGLRLREDEPADDDRPGDLDPDDESPRREGGDPGRGSGGPGS